MSLCGWRESFGKANGEVIRLSTTSADRRRGFSDKRESERRHDYRNPLLATIASPRSLHLESLGRQPSRDKLQIYEEFGHISKVLTYFYKLSSPIAQLYRESKETHDCIVMSCVNAIGLQMHEGTNGDMGVMD
jgi:hypothetical protein